MKVNKKLGKLGDLLIVTWLDACRCRHMDEVNEGLVNETCGFLVKFGRKCVHVAQEKSEDQNCDEFRDITSIPYGMILKIQKIH